MAITLEGKIGEVSSAVPSSSIVITSAINATVGSFICVVVLVSIKAGGATHAPTATDSSSNSYSLIYSAPNAGVGKAIYVLGSKVTTQLDIADTITVTLNASVAVRVAHAFSVIGVSALDVSSYKISSIGRPTSGITPKTSEDNSFALAFGAVYRGLRLTLAGSAPWTRLTALSSSNLNLTSYYQIIHSESTVEFRSSTVASSPWYCAALVFKAGDGVPGVIAKVVTINDNIRSSESVDSIDFPIEDRYVDANDHGIGTDVVLHPLGAPYFVDVSDTITNAERFSLSNPLITTQLRMGNSVPSEAVNLAWLDFPDASPDANVSVIKSAELIPESYNGVRGYATDPGTGRRGPNGWSLLFQYNPKPSGTSISTGPSGYVLSLQPDSTGEDPVWLSTQLSKSINLEPPKQDSIAWRIRVEDGLVLKRYILVERDQSWLRNVFNVGDELLLYYTVIESSYQKNDTGSFLTEVHADPVLIEGRKIKLPHNNIDSILSVTLSGRELLPSGTVTRATAIPVDDLESWNPDRGELIFKRTFSDTSDIKTNYVYSENFLNYTGYYDSVTNVFRDLDICPINGHTYDNGRSTSELIGRPIYIYLLPAAACRLSKLSATGVRVTDPDRIIYSGMRFIRSFMRWQLGKANDIQD